MRSHVTKVLAVLLTVVLTIGAADLVMTKRSGLSLTDRRALEEFQTLAETPHLWRDVDLASNPFVLMSKDSGFSYLVTKDPVSSLFAEPIPGPTAEGFHVYRLAHIYPQLLPTWLMGGNFTTIGHPKRVLGQDTYYVKFGEHSFDIPNSSEHFITFLAHEAFHFYGQEHWGMDPGPTGEPDLSLLQEELVLFDEIRDATDPNHLKDLARAVLDVEQRRQGADPEYVAAERWKATVEGTATYVGIKASEAVGYDFGPMYFDNTANAPFSDVVPFYQSGQLDRGFLNGPLPYETGAQLALLLDALDPAQNWQLYLNDQSPTERRTLIDALERTLLMH